MSSPADVKTRAVPAPAAAVRAHRTLSRGCISGSTLLGLPLPRDRTPSLFLAAASQPHCADAEASGSRLLRPRGHELAAGGTLSQVWPQHGHPAREKRGGFAHASAPTPESPRGEAPGLLLIPPGDPSKRQTLRRGALTSLGPPPAAPAAHAGLQDQGCPQEALQGLLHGKETWALVRAL